MPSRRDIFRAGAIIGAASFLPTSLLGCGAPPALDALGRVVDDGVTPRAFDARGFVWLLSPAEGRVEVRDVDGSVVHAVDGLARPASLALEPTGRGWVVELDTGTLVAIDVERRTAIRVGADVLRAPRDVAIDLDGQLLVAEPSLHRITRLDDEGRLLASLGTPITRGPAEEEGVLNGPRSLAVANDGTILVAELGARRVTRLDAQGAWLETVASGFRAPRQLRVGPDGRFAVADVVRGVVDVFDADGLRLDTYESPSRLPETLAFAPNGALWISGRGRVA